jgi:hypothetical protein
MADWKSFRDSLELSEDPIADTIKFFNRAPIVKIAVDPYDMNSWPTPWELIENNVYCDFIKILAICYTLQLTTKFSNCHFEIHITHDKENSITKYLCIVGELCIGYEYDNAIFVKDLPRSFQSEIKYNMPPLQ